MNGYGANMFNQGFDSNFYATCKAAQLNCNGTGIPSLDGSGNPNAPGWGGGNGGNGPGWGGGNGGIGPGDGSGPGAGTPSCPWTADIVSTEFAALGMNVENHYRAFGAFERNDKGEFGIDPSQTFDTSKYFLWKQALLQRDGVNLSMQELVDSFRDANIDPLAHSVQFGAAEGIHASIVQSDALDGMTEWNEMAYCAANADINQAIELGIIGSGFEHYLYFGQFEGRSLE